jgi:hypothetical protein
MGRWDYLERDNARDSETGSPREERHHGSSAASVSLGRRPTDGSSTKSRERPESPRQGSKERSHDRRADYRYEGRTYSLRSSEIAAMVDIGRFRAIDVRDLAEFVYDGNEARVKYDLESLRTQGLVEEKTLFRAHKKARTLVTLTAEGELPARRLAALSTSENSLWA